MSNGMYLGDHLVQQYQKRRAFAVHAVVYVGFAVLSLVFFLDQAFWRGLMTLPNTGDLALILALWTVIFAAHLVDFLLYESYQRRAGSVDKPKRQPLDEYEAINERLQDDYTNAQQRARR